MADTDTKVNLHHYSAHGFLLYALVAACIVAIYAFARPEFQELLPAGELFSLCIVRLTIVLACSALGLAVAGAGNQALGLAICFAFAGALAVDVHQSWVLLSGPDAGAAAVTYGSSTLPTTLPVALLLFGIALSRVTQSRMPRTRLVSSLFLSLVITACIYFAIAHLLGWLWQDGGRGYFYGACIVSALTLLAIATYFGLRHWFAPTGVSAGVAMFLTIHVFGALYTTARGLESHGGVFEMLLLDLLAISAIPYGFVLDGIQALSSTRLHASALRDPARLDPLTGLLNRRAVDTVGASLFEEAQQSGRPVSVLMIDLDHFKDLNDTHGHQAGDFVLQCFGDLLRVCVRDTDLVARYGGEEFIVVLPGAPLAPALRLGERIRNRAEHHVFQQADKIYRITVSIGAATAFPGEINVYPDLIGLADRNLYRAKREGRNRVLSAPIE